jgi:hypothetical protein
VLMVSVPLQLLRPNAVDFHLTTSFSQVNGPRAASTNLLDIYAVPRVLQVVVPPPPVFQSTTVPTTFGGQFQGAATVSDLASVMPNRMRHTCARPRLAGSEG